MHYDYTRTKDVLPNIDRTQAAVSVQSRHPLTPDGQGVDPSAARVLQRAALAIQYMVNEYGLTVFRFFFIPGDLGL